MKQIRLPCPVCETHFASLAGGRADLRVSGAVTSARIVRAGARFRISVHVCVCCGYAGLVDQFDPSVEVTSALRDRVWSELAPRLPVVPSMLLLPHAGSEKYESFDEAFDSYDGVAREERAAITYLGGELWRRIGDDSQAVAWFARVPL